MSNVAHEIIIDIINNARKEDHPEIFIRGAIVVLKGAKLDVFDLITEVTKHLGIDSKEFE
jgi:hypothetical protein